MKRNGVWPVLRNIAVGVVFLAVTAVLLMWLAGAFEPKIDDHTPAAPAAALRPVGDTPLIDAKTIRVPKVETAAGTVEAVRRTTLASRLLAAVTEVRVQAGQPVEADEILMLLDSSDLTARMEQTKAALAASEAELAQAKIDLGRAEKLHAEDVASASEYDLAKTRFATASAGVDRTSRHLEEMKTTVRFATIRAPFSGIVVDKLVDAGDTVTPGQTLLTLYDPTQMQLVANVRESLARRLQVGDFLDVRLDVLGKACQGRISEIVPTSDPASRTFAVKVTGPCPPDVMSGMFGRLLIPLEEEEILVIPLAAVRTVGQLKLVDVADGDRLTLRTVQLGREMEDNVQVLSGLKAGERVALGDS